MNDVLIVLNPRRIRESVDAIAALDIDRVWVRNMSEADIVASWERIIGCCDGYDWAWIVSDDTLPTQDALDAVRELAGFHTVVTGYCNLDMDEHAHVANVCKSPLGPRSTPDAFDFYTVDEIRRSPSEAVTTTFVGFALTGMSVDMWKWFPYQLEPEGWSADYNLSKRLAASNVRMVCARDGYVAHLKETWNRPDANPRHRLLVGVEPASVDVDVRHDIAGVPI